MAPGYRELRAVSQSKHESRETAVLLRLEANSLEDQIALDGHHQALAAGLCHSREL